MGHGYKRADLRANAQAKIDDAVILFQNRRFSNAYYLAGYAVEIALKACVAAKITAETIPDKSIINNIFNHKFSTLIGLAGLATELKEQQDRDAGFSANWAVVSEWEPDTRYESTDVTSAQQIISAITDPKSGVLQWIKNYW